MATKTFGFLIPCAIALSGTLAASTPAVSATLSWDNWANAPGSSQFKTGAAALAAPQSFAVDTGTVSLDFNVGAGTQLVSFDKGLTPQINNVLNGSQPDFDSLGMPINRSLHLQMDTKEYGNDNNVKMNVGFNGYGGAVQNVGFWLYDIDMSPDKGSDNLLRWQDRVKVVGYKGTTLVDALFSNLGQNVENLGSGVLQGIDSTDNEGDKSDKSNVWVQFAGDIDRFSLIFTDGNSNQVTQNDPESHGIGIGNIQFNKVRPVPEPTDVPEPTNLGALGALTLIGMLVRRKQNQQE